MINRVVFPKTAWFLRLTERYIRSRSLFPSSSASSARPLLQRPWSPFSTIACLVLAWDFDINGSLSLEVPSILSSSCSPDISIHGSSLAIGRVTPSSCSHSLLQQLLTRPLLWHLQAHHLSSLLRLPCQALIPFPRFSADQSCSPWCSCFRWFIGQIDRFIDKINQLISFCSIKFPNQIMKQFLSGFVKYHEYC
jgi:hypothetical protein